MIRSFCRIAVALVVAAAVLRPAAAADPTPQATVETLHSLLLEVMKQPGSAKDRMATLAPRLEKIYDYRRMSAAVGGKPWADAPEPARSEFMKAFGNLSAATYASRFKGYAGERFEIVGTRKGPRDLHLVDTRIIPSEGEPVSISYVLHQDGNLWRIVDVLLSSSISEIAVRRSEYNSTLRQSGLSGLAGVLDAKADALIAGG